MEKVKILWSGITGRTGKEAEAIAQNSVAFANHPLAISIGIVLSNKRKDIGGSPHKNGVLFVVTLSLRLFTELE